MIHYYLDGEEVTDGQFFDKLDECIEYIIDDEFESTIDFQFGSIYDGVVTIGATEALIALHPDWYQDARTTYVYNFHDNFMSTLHEQDGQREELAGTDFMTRDDKLEPNVDEVNLYDEED